MGRAQGEKIPKPSKITGTRWITYCYNTMKVILKYYVMYMTYLEEPANNDNIPEKHAQIQEFLNKWDYAKYPIHLAVYLQLFS